MSDSSSTPYPIRQVSVVLDGKRIVAKGRTGFSKNYTPAETQHLLALASSEKPNTPAEWDQVAIIFNTYFHCNRAGKDLRKKFMKMVTEKPKTGTYYTACTGLTRLNALFTRNALCSAWFDGICTQ
jgi:hypothetical protein